MRTVFATNEDGIPRIEKTCPGLPTALWGNTRSSDLQMELELQSDTLLIDPVHAAVFNPVQNH